LKSNNFLLRNQGTSKEEEKMRRSKSVTFSLAPIVRLYNKMVSPHSSPEFSPRALALEPAPAPAPAQQEQKQQQEQEQTQFVVEGFAPLTISIPKTQEQEQEQEQDQDDDHYEEPPAYDKSPLTPKSWEKILLQRCQEAEIRAKAIKRAISNFHASSPVMSPLALPSPVLK